MGPGHCTGKTGRYKSSPFSWALKMNRGPEDNTTSLPGTPSYLGGRPRVIRTGGITGTLPSQSRIAVVPPSSQPHPPPPPITSPHPPPPPITSPPPTSNQTPPPTPSPPLPHAPRLTQVPVMKQSKVSKEERRGSTIARSKSLPSNDVLDALFDRLTVGTRSTRVGGAGIVGGAGVWGRIRGIFEAN